MASNVSKVGVKANFAQIEVLQNGQTVDSCHRQLGKHRNIVLSPHGGDLHLPLYPLADSMTLASVERQHLTFYLTPQMTGFVTQSGRVIDLDQGQHTSQELELKAGDYGSINFRDLTFLIKVSPLKKAASKAIPLDPRYRGTLGSTLFQGSQEISAFLAAIGIALLLLVGLTASSFLVVHDAPKTLDDLPEPYQLALISPDILRTSPEALQFALDRSAYVPSVLNYYRSLHNMYLGLGSVDEALIFPATAARYQRAFADYFDGLAAFRKREEGLERQVLQRSGVAVAAIPAVLGESAATATLRTLDKLESRLIAHERLMGSRKSISEAFGKDDDYPFNDYRNTKHNNAAQEKLAKISPFRLLTDEGEMYAHAENLARMGAYRQREMNKSRRDPIQALDSKNYRPVRLATTSPFVSLLNNGELFSLDRKLELLQAAELDTLKKSRVKEPLVGEIDPKLVEKVISSGKFDLQLCYELALRRNSGTAGTVEWSWRIDSRGSISDLELLTSTIKDDVMLQCLRNKISSWSFPRPSRGSVLIRYPFSFKPRQG